MPFSLLSYLFYRKVYSCGMAQNLQKLAERHKDVVVRFPDSPFAKALAEPSLWRSGVTLADFDQAVTRHVGGGPPFPFASAYDYYAAASSHTMLEVSLALSSCPAVPSHPNSRRNTPICVSTMANVGRF